MKRSTRRSNIKPEPLVGLDKTDTPKQTKLHDQPSPGNAKRSSRKKNIDDSAVVSGSLDQTVEDATQSSTPKQKSKRGRPSLKNKTETKETEKDAKLDQTDSITDGTNDELDNESGSNIKQVSSILDQTVEDATQSSTLKQKSKRGRPSLKNKTETKVTEKDVKLDQNDTSITGGTNDELDNESVKQVSISLDQTVESVEDMTQSSTLKQKSKRGRPSLKSKTETKETEKDAKLDQTNTSITGGTTDELDNVSVKQVSSSLDQTVESVEDMTQSSTPKQKSKRGRPSLKGKTETKETEKDAKLNQNNTSITGGTTDELDNESVNRVSSSLDQTVESVEVITQSSTPKQKSKRGRPSLKSKTETKVTEKETKLGQTNTDITGETSEESDTESGSNIEHSKAVNAKTSRRELKRKTKEESESSFQESNNDDDDYDDEKSDQSIEYRPQKRKSQRKKIIRRILESDDSGDEIVNDDDEIVNDDNEIVNEKVSAPDEETKVNESHGANEECQPIKRGRGRPRKNFGDTSLSIKGTPTPTKKSRGRKKAAITAVDDTDSEEESNDSESKIAMVICQVCNKEMTRKEFKKTHRDYHYGLCWTQYDEPIDIYNPQTVMEILYLKRKKVVAQTGRRLQIDLSFSCRFCNEVKRSELGYYSHMLVCNRTKEEIEKSNKRCPICHKEIFLPHYRAHENKHSKVSAAEEVEIEVTPEVVEVVAGKRSAARRAQSKISKITANLLDNKTGEKNKKCDEDFEPSENEEEEEGSEESEGERSEESEGEREVIDESETEETRDESFMDFSDIFESGDVCKDQIYVQSAAVRQPFSKKFYRIEDLTFVYESEAALGCSEPHELFTVPPFEYLAETVAEEYLPRTKTSMMMTSSHKENFKLDLFASEMDTSQSVLFCGGPVFAMAWCPHPMALSATNEYLAIASQPDMNRTHKKNVSESYKSIIQLWRFPESTCLKPTKSLHAPEMVLGIAHEGGAVWDLAWCPSGGYIQDKTQGVLAAACSSGKVFIYAVPWLDNIDVTKRISCLKPILILQIDEFNKNPCYCIAWQNVSPNNFIYAGYSDGCLAIFDINASDILKCDGNVMLPVNVVQAHLTEILVISLCSCEDTFLLLTASNDRLTKVWDLADFTSPLTLVNQKATQKRPLCGGFFPNLPLYLMGSDHIYFEEASYLAITPIRDFALAKDGLPRIRQSVAHFTLTFSKYCGSLVIGNEDGQVSLVDYRKTVFNRKKEKPVIIFNSSLMPIDEDDAEKYRQGMETHCDAVSKYEDVCQRYKIDFTSKSKTKKELSISIKRPSLSSADVVNVTSTCWNNNTNNFQLLAMGQKCGIVHVMKVDSHSQYQLDFFSNFLEKQGS